MDCLKTSREICTGVQAAEDATGIDLSWGQKQPAALVFWRGLALAASLWRSAWRHYGAPPPRRC